MFVAGMWVYMDMVLAFLQNFKYVRTYDIKFKVNWNCSSNNDIVQLELISM